MCLEVTHTHTHTDTGTHARMHTCTHARMHAHRFWLSNYFRLAGRWSRGKFVRLVAMLAVLVCVWRVYWRGYNAPCVERQGWTRCHLVGTYKSQQLSAGEPTAVEILPWSAVCRFPTVLLLFHWFFFLLRCGEPLLESRQLSRYSRGRQAKCWLSARNVMDLPAAAGGGMYQ